MKESKNIDYAKEIFEMNNINRNFQGEIIKVGNAVCDLVRFVVPQVRGGRILAAQLCHHLGCPQAPF